jgi:hypothetical protein
MPTLTLAEAAELMGIKKPRARQILLALQIPVSRRGIMLFVERDDLRPALTRNTKRGRKPLTKGE